MHRSGIEPGPEAVELYRLIDQLPAIAPGGLHVYDGHLRDPNLEARTLSVANRSPQWMPCVRNLLPQG